jgi:hypothetical protein
MKREITYCDYPNCKSEGNPVTALRYTIASIAGCRAVIEITIPHEEIPTATRFLDLCPRHEYAVWRELINQIENMANSIKRGS